MPASSTPCGSPCPASLPPRSSGRWSVSLGCRGTGSSTSSPPSISRRSATSRCWSRSSSGRLSSPRRCPRWSEATRESSGSMPRTRASRQPGCFPRRDSGRGSSSSLIGGYVALPGGPVTAHLSGRRRARKAISFATPRQRSSASRSWGGSPTRSWRSSVRFGTEWLRSSGRFRRWLFPC